MTHPFDAAIALHPEADNRYGGHTSAAYANMVGPFGGITAASLLHAICRHPARLGDPLAFTVNFAGPVADGPFQLHAVPVRTNRSTQHWRVELIQDDTVATTATAVFGVRRETWSSNELTRPAVPPAAEVAVTPPPGRVAWMAQYELRYITGGLPDFRHLPAPDDSIRRDTTTAVWVRDEPQRPLDFLSLASICDVFIPRIYLRRARPVPAGTVSITTYFHADAAVLAAQGSEPVLGVARAQNFRNGFFDQSAEVWGAGEVLLASTHQIVYYKE